VIIRYIDIVKSSQARPSTSFVEFGIAPLLVLPVGFAPEPEPVAGGLDLETDAAGAGVPTVEMLTEE
jgi:hypothetical protein